MDMTNKRSDEYYVTAGSLWMVLAVILEKNEGGICLHTKVKFEWSHPNFLLDISISAGGQSRMAQRPTQSLSPRLPASLTGLKKFPDFRHSYMFLARHPLFPAYQHPSRWHYLPLYNSVTTRHPRLPPHSPSPRFSFLKDLNSFLNDSISYSRTQNSSPVPLKFNE